MVRARAAMRGRIPITTLPCFFAIWTTAAGNFTGSPISAPKFSTAAAASSMHMPYDAGAYRDRTPLMFEIRRDGIDL